MSGSLFVVAIACALAIGCWLGWKIAWRKAVRANLDGIEVGANAGPTYEAAEALYMSCLRWADELDVPPPTQPEEEQR